MKRMIKKLWLPLSLGLIVMAAVAVFPTGGEAEVYDKVIRLHVLANSDSEADQQLKLKVRDAILVKAASLTEGCADRREAEAALADKTELLRLTAEEALQENGCDRTVAVTIGQEHYPTREYEGVRLPAGDYCSLRVLIGEAEGQNWWCVLFPPLCVGSASEVEEEMVSAGFTPGQVKILTESESPRYKLKFKILEILGSLFS
ncbi:MAG: stage II sporulation protein R [Clostridia bacterium]|nr:stage II sporulation protein R [Clostridia bacterium]